MNNQKLPLEKPIFNKEACLPDIWGEGAIFAFSGMDGETCSASGFVASYDHTPHDLLIHTPRRIRLKLRLPDPVRVMAATNDILAADTPQGEMMVTFSAWHTLIGKLPKSVNPQLEAVDLPNEPEPTPYLLRADTAGQASLALATDNERFALAYGSTPEEAGERARDGLRISLDSIITNRLAWINHLPELDTCEDTRFLRKCASVMKVNTLAPEAALSHPWSTPDRIPHQHMWLWDSVFHTIGMNWLDPDLSWEFLLSMLEQIQPDGLMPITVHIDGASYRMTQPPILAWGVWKNYCITHNLARLAQALPALEDYLAWNLENRDRNRNGLLEWLIEENERCRSGESGMDNSPRFDSALTLDAVDFSTFQALDMDCLAQICTELGEREKASSWQQRSRQTSQAIHTFLWNAEMEFYTDRDMNGNFTNVRACSGFLPLLLGDLPAGRAAALLTALKDPQAFDAPFPVPSLALDHPAWSTDMWRGATWMNYNYLIIQGLYSQGYPQEAKTLANKSLAFVRKYYQQFGVIFEFFDSSDQRTPPECDRKGPHRLPYDIRRKVDSIRDYHWTAALCLSLLLEEG